MKNAFLLLALVLGSCAQLSAQNYQTFYSHRIAFFDAKAIRIDSVKIEENDSVFYPIKAIRRQNYECFTPYGASFLGEKIVIKDNWNYFFNGQGDTIKIKTDAILNESFELFYLKDSISAIATVISHETEKFLEVNDLVKTLEIKIFDNKGNQIQDLYVQKNPVIRLSQNYGLLKTFNFYDFYFRYGNYYSGYGAAYNTYSLLGLTNPNVGAQNLTWFEVFDFQPGDELHIVDEYNDYFSFHQELIKIIEKYQSRTDYGNDSISYNILRTQHRYRIDYTGQVTENTISSQNTTYIYRTNLDFDRLSGEPIIHYDNYGNGSAYELTGYSQGKTVPFQVESIYNSKNNECWRQDTWDGCFSADHYRKGLGGPYHDFCQSNLDGSTYEKKLVYYKKGDIEWGTPLKITGINDIKANAIQVKYDKATESILINSDLPASSYSFELIDLKGQILIQEKITSSPYSISAGNLQRGLYLYRLVEGETVYSGKIVK